MRINKIRKNLCLQLIMLGFKATTPNSLWKNWLKLEKHTVNNPSFIIVIYIHNVKYFRGAIEIYCKGISKKEFSINQNSFNNIMQIIERINNENK